MKRGLKYDFTLISILLIPIGVAINVVGSQLTQLLRLPVFLDVIGTFIVAMVAGPWVGAVTGGATNLVLGVFNPVLIPFGLVSIAVGLVVGFLSRAGMFTKFWKALIAGVIVTLVGISISSPIQVLLFGGIAGHGSDVIVAAFLASGQKIWAAVISKQLIVTSIDKILSSIIAFFIVKKMSDRYLSKLNYGSIYIQNSKSRK